MDSANINTAEQNIAQVKTALKAFVENEKIAKMLGKDFVSEMNDWEALIEKKSEEPFTLVILGEFKRGKSTIINALLGKELAPINVTPETYTINEISFGHTQYVEAILENGMRVPLSLEDITREKLEQRMKLFPAKISYVQIKDNAPILKEIRIVDTPGLSDLESLDKQVMDYIVNADAIMYAASCLLPFSESEQLFLASHVQPQRFGMLYILVNMIDAMNSQKDADKILKRVRNISERIVPNAIVYGISGADELSRKLGRERPLDKGTREFYETQFFQFELFHLLFVQFLLVFRFGTLQVEFKDRCSYIDGVAAFLVYLDDTGVDGGIDDLFESGYYLARGADRYFDDALVDGGYSQVFTVQAGLQERYDHGNDGYGRSHASPDLYDLFALFFSSNFF